MACNIVRPDERRFNVAQEEGMRENTHFYHIEDGLHYHVNQENAEQRVVYYKCVRYERGCRGRAIFTEENGFRHQEDSPHNHEPDLWYPDEMALRRNILRRCSNLHYVSFQDIILEESLRFPPEVRARVYYNRMRTPMRNARFRNLPPIPNNLRELTNTLNHPLHRVLTMTQDGLDNIYGGSVDDALGNHHILFISQRMLAVLRDLTVIQSDGTFKSVPAGLDAAQVFCIVGVWNDQVIPIAWALMESQTEEAYTAVLSLLRELLGPNIELTRAITDFEAAMQNAWQNVFHVAVQGCLWHLCRAFLTEIASLNITRHMRRIAQVKRIVRLSMGLALLPEHLILQGYELILREARDEGNYIFALVAPFLRYLWVYWVSRPWRRARMCVFGSHQRTNNCCESHNKVLRNTVGVHPNVYRFIEGLVKLEQMSFEMTNVLEGARRPRRGRRLSSVLADDRLRNLTEELLQPPGPIRHTIFRFLRAASHCMDNILNEAEH